MNKKNNLFDELSYLCNSNLSKKKKSNVCITFQSYV